MAGYVYLIGSPTFKWYKIGKSTNAQIRVTTLGVLLPFRIEVIAVWKTNNPSGLEYSLHERCAESRINGEWFSFTDQEVKAIVEDMLWAQTDVLPTFSNMERDIGPLGQFIKVKFKTKLPVAFVQAITPEERHERMMKHRAKKIGRPYCRTCRRPMGRTLP